MHSWVLDANSLWVEKDLWSLGLLRGQEDLFSVWKMEGCEIPIVLLLEAVMIILLNSDRHTHVALKFFYLLANFKLGGGVEDIAASSKKLLEVLGYVSTT